VLIIKDLRKVLSFQNTTLLLYTTKEKGRRMFSFAK